MKFKNVLVLYKRSAYGFYFLNKKSSLRTINNQTVREERARFEQAHKEHYETLKTVSQFFLEKGIHFDECYRGRKIDYSRYDLIVTVGGDGTFLEAARFAKKQLIIGVNSAPEHSVGRFCITEKKTFVKVMEHLLTNNFEEAQFQRLRLTLDGKVQPMEALNDVLICHKNPAFLCRYYLTIGKDREEQRSSGVWVATPAGSTGAIASAGGKVLNPYLKKLQYMPRELYRGKDKKYKLNGGVLTPPASIEIVSLMREGMVYFDGAHHKFAFPYGSKLKISISKHFVKTVKI